MMEGYYTSNCDNCGALAICLNGICQYCYDDPEDFEDPDFLPTETEMNDDYCPHDWIEVGLEGEVCSECTICGAIDC